MAKKDEIKVSICTLADYLEGKENIANVLFTAFEDYDLQLFERVRSADTKEQAIQLGRDLWSQAQLIANKESAWETYKTIKIVIDDIDHAKTALTIGANWLGKIAYNWKLFRCGFKRINAVDFLAMHIANHGYNIEEYDKFINLLDENIVTHEELGKLFDVRRVQQLIPIVWPETDENYFSVAEVPYLEKLVDLAILKEYSSDDMTEAWDEMRKMKLDKVDTSSWKECLVSFDEALYLLFASQTPYVVKKHYAAFLDLVNRR